MVHKAQHEIAAGFDIERNGLLEVKERATYSLKLVNFHLLIYLLPANYIKYIYLMQQDKFKRELTYLKAIGEDPDDAVQCHQFGLHCLSTQEFKTSQTYLKAAIARLKESVYGWSNLGISLQLLEESSQAEEVYKRALSLAISKQGHTIFSNLGNFYRQLRKFEFAKAMFEKSLELQPGYAPVYNNLGLVFVAEGRWAEAMFCFNKAIETDPLLDADKSNTIKVATMCKWDTGLASCISD